MPLRVALKPQPKLIPHLDAVLRVSSRSCICGDTKMLSIDIKQSELHGMILQ